jgi:hypothetical protein
MVQNLLTVQIVFFKFNGKRIERLEPAQRVFDELRAFGVKFVFDRESS